MMLRLTSTITSMLIATALIIFAHPLQSFPEAPQSGPLAEESEPRFWTVQAASFRNLEPARRVIDEAAQPEGRVEFIDGWFTVRYGLYHEVAGAERLRKRLAAAGLENLLVRTCYHLSARVVYAGQGSPKDPQRETESQPADGDDQIIERALSMARAGQPAPAVALLEPIVRRRPEDAKLREDLVVILQWAGQDAAALEEAQHLELEQAPPYVIASLAKSARNLGLYERSIELYRMNTTGHPDKLQSQAGLAMALTDAGRPHEALQQLAPLLQTHGRHTDLLSAQAYAHEARDETLEALWLYEEILRSRPDRQDVHRQRLLALSALGAPNLALAEARKKTGLLTDDDLTRIRGDRAAFQVRWGNITPDSAAARFAETDDAIGTLEANIRRLTLQGASADHDSPALLRARFDRLVALRDRVRMDEVVAEYEALAYDGKPLPVYVLAAAGDAHLYLERPREAARIYQEALAADPQSDTLPVSLFWAHIELGEFDRAAEIIDTVSARQPEWRINRTAGERTIYGENDPKLAGDSAAALVRALADDLAGAQQRLQALHEAAPFNHDLRQRLGHVYLWRGWPRRALGEFESILPVDPELLDARVGRAEALLELRHYGKAEEIVTALETQYPEHKRVQQLARDWVLHNQWQLTTDLGYGNDSGTDQDTDSFRIDTHLSSPPLHDRFRIFLRSFYEQADIGEDNGTIANQREAVGLAYGGPGLRGLLALGQNKGSDNDADLAGRFDWDLNDHWTVGASFDTYSLDAPLRGVLNDITAWSAAFDLGYRAHESTGARLSLQRLDFDDGNIRNSGLLSLTHRVINGPYVKAPVILDFYGSENSKKDRPYFNPDKDYSITATIDLRWLLWRCYTRSFAQNLAFTGGIYRQRGFGSDGIGGLRYEHDWHFSDTLSLRYGVSWRQRVYDGDSEESTWSYASVDWRF